MGFSTPFLLVLACAAWCFLGQVLSLPSRINRGPLSLTSSVAKSPLRGDFSECGISRKTDPEKLSIVGGEEAILGEWPWMVALMAGSPSNPSEMVLCGGSLISRQWVITAAHCHFGFDSTDSVYVRLGELDIDDRVKDGALPIDIAIDEFVVHPEFSMHPFGNDIALIRLKKPIHFTENIHPICLFSGQESKTNEFYYGEQPYIIGWGTTKFRGNTSSILLETTVDVVTIEECRNYSKLNESFTIDEKVICAGGKEKSSCHGDSGGPLIFLNGEENRFYIGGIVSGGIPGGDYCTDGPVIYTKVAKFSCWINEVTGEDL